MIDTEKAALCARIDDLCAEVERLKQQNAMLRELENIRISQVKYCEDLDAENSKLRELAKQMHICLTRPKVYDGEQPYLTATECPYFTEGACDYNACAFEQRMHELGVEL